MTSPPIASQGTTLADKARARFVSDAAQAMEALADLVQARLTVLLNEAGMSRDKQHRRDVWMLYKRARVVWVDGTVLAWQSALKPDAAQAKAPEAVTNFHELALVGTEKVENTILAGRLARDVREKIDPLLEELTLRIRRLEGGEKLAEHDVLVPEVLLLLMVEQWRTSGMALESWALISEALRPLVTERLLTAYSNCNQFLAAQGAAPLLEHKDRIKRPPAVAVATAPAPARMGRGPDSGFGRQGSGILDQLKRLLSPQGSADNRVGDNSTLGRSSLLVAALAPKSHAGQAPSSSDTVVDDFSPEGMRRVAYRLREESSEIKSKAGSSREKATIEIVALMFQSILAEARIAPAIRVWFARLQMPVLREALDDPDFVVELDHPARRLIDRMGSCVLGFDASNINARVLEAEVKRVVQVIEQYPDTGKRVYQLMLQEFERFLTRFLVGKGAPEQLRTVAQLVELKETLTIQYTIKLRKMLKDMQVRDVIRDFLFKVWAEVLAVATLRQGAQHAGTMMFKRTAADLVWVVSAKASRHERARAMQQLPQLLDQLRLGMSLLGLPAVEQEAYVKTVNTTLADAFMSKTQAIPQAKIDDMAQLEPLVSDEEAGDLSLNAQSIEMLLGIEAAAIDVMPNGDAQPDANMLHWAQALQTGDWFTLNHNGVDSQVQFSWRSDKKHLNLFASVDGHCYLIQTKRLGAYLQAGLLLPLEEETLTVRAARDALAKLEANPERLLN